MLRLAAGYRGVAESRSTSSGYVGADANFGQVTYRGPGLVTRERIARSRTPALNTPL